MYLYNIKSIWLWRDLEIQYQRSQIYQKSNSKAVRFAERDMKTLFKLSQHIITEYNVILNTLWLVLQMG